MERLEPDESQLRRWNSCEPAIDVSESHAWTSTRATTASSSRRDRDADSHESGTREVRPREAPPRRGAAETGGGGDDATVAVAVAAAAAEDEEIMRRRRKKRGKSSKHRGRNHGGCEKAGGGGRRGSIRPEERDVERGDCTTPTTGDDTCRICMESVSQSEFELGKALHLGCKCAAGLDVVHVGCAKKWFRIRKSTTCEICEEEAANLPEALKIKIREWAEARSRRQQRTRSRIRLLAQTRRVRSQSEELHLCTYTTFCLLPAALAAIILVFFYYESLELPVVLTMILAIIISSLTMLHWLIDPNRPVLHIIFVIMFVGSIMAISFFFVEVHSWSALEASISAAVVGGLFSTGLYAALRALSVLLLGSHRGFLVGFLRARVSQEEDQPSGDVSSSRISAQPVNTNTSNLPGSQLENHNITNEMPGQAEDMSSCRQGQGQDQSAVNICNA